MIDFADMIFHHALSQPEKPAIILSDRLVTYAMVARGAMSVADRIAALNLPRHALVAIAVDSPLRHMILATALYRLGHPSLSVWATREIPAIGLPIAVILEGNRAALAPGLNQVLVEDDWFGGEASPFNASPAAGFGGDDAVARVALSSGTTGTPKAISLSVAAVRLWVRNYYFSIGCADWSRMLLLPGLATSWGFTMAAHTLGAGKTLCFAADARETLDMIALHRIDCLAAATQHVHDLIAEQQRQPVPLPTLRVVTAAGSLMSREMLRDARAALCPQIWINYGSTEAACTAYALTDQLLATEGAVGFVCPWAEVEVLGDDGGALPPDTDGAYRIRADCMGRPYPAPQPGDSIRDGWFYPGDRGRIRPDGMLIVSGRVTDIINVAGTKMAPELIEDVVRRHPAVADVAAVGVMGASGLEEVWLAVVTRGPLVPEEIVALCAAVEIPVARVVTVVEIPRNVLAKIERGRIKKEIQAITNG